MRINFLQAPIASKSAHFSSQRPKAAVLGDRMEFLQWVARSGNEDLIISCPPMNFDARRPQFIPLSLYAQRKFPQGARVTVEGGSPGIDRILFRLCDTYNRLPSTPKEQELKSALAASEKVFPITTRDIRGMLLKKKLQPYQMHPAYLETTEGDDAKFQWLLRQTFKPTGKPSSQDYETDMKVFASLGNLLVGDIVTAKPLKQMPDIRINRGILYGLPQAQRKAYLSKTAEEQTSGSVMMLGDADLMTRTTPEIFCDLEAAGYRPSRSTANQACSAFIKQCFETKGIARGPLQDPRPYLDKGVIWVKK